MKEFLAICSLFSPFVWYYIGHYRGYLWTKKNPDKYYIEYFFEVEKENPPKNES